MANYTLTYSPMLDGWTSFHSYYPEWMDHMNSFMYTFKSGEMWKHNTNPVRNSWYGVTYPSSVTVLFNDAPNEPKMFKTLSYDSDHKWSAVVNTDLNSGSMDKTYFEEKEGFFFTYVRRNPGTIDYKAMSTQGIGNVSSASVDPLSGHLSVFFDFAIPNLVSVGDVLYCVISGVNTQIGLIDEIVNDPLTGYRLVINAPYTTVNTGDFSYAIKNSVAESYGARGYYMEATLTNNDTEAVELFAISSQIFKSYP